MRGLLALSGVVAGCSGKIGDDSGDGGSLAADPADLLFVVDNSLSMADESSAIALGFSSFSGQTDADWQAGITTTSIDEGGGATAGLDPGEAGLLLGDPAVAAEESAFRTNLLCRAIPWSEDEVASDPGYACGDPVEAISREYLDCECGAGAWESYAGSGLEEPLEAALLALCRAVDSPPEACFHALSAFTEADSGTNEPLLRPDAPVVLVIVGDEGDSSRQIEQGDGDPQAYLDAFASFGLDLRVVAIGPDYDPDAGELTCNSGGATTWAVERLYNAAIQTGGFYAPLTTADCGVADMGAAMTQLADLLAPPPVGGDTGDTGE